jgi:hypothetical protein
VFDRTEDLSKKRFYNRDFSGLDLSRLKLRHSVFYNCNFNSSNLSETDCEGSEFFGSTFIDSVCYRTNFKDAKLAGTTFAPKDCMGMTVTMQCQTFDGMKVSPLWFLCWLLMATMMVPGDGVFGKGSELVDKLINVIGTERYLKLRGLFGKRNL